MTVWVEVRHDVADAADRILRVAAALLVAVLLTVGLLSGLAGLYTMKRALGIDVVPGVDMVDDARMERLIGAVL